MALFFYHIFLLLFRLFLHIASGWNKKAALWVNGRKNIFHHLQTQVISEPGSLIWVHCASLGEFEQGRPVLEKLRTRYPTYKILLTFFSPSGYEIRKDYRGADWVFYLPADSRANARKFLNIIRPALVLFIKYDYWYFYLTECKKRKIPLLMVSAVFRKNQPFFRWYGFLHRKMLHCFTHFFVQDENSKILLQNLGIERVTRSGDTRFDRVIEIAEKSEPPEVIKKFCGKAKVLVAGSTWPADEKLIQTVLPEVSGWKLILAPHEINPGHLAQLKLLFPQAVFLSEIDQPHEMRSYPDCLIIDNIGLLSKIYACATLAYIGGGFNRGIHNVLEAAVYGVPLFFGPRFEKFREAVDLQNEGAAFCVQTAAELIQNLKLLMQDAGYYNRCCQQAKQYVYNNKGATEKIFYYIQENRLLTS